MPSLAPLLNHQAFSTLVINFHRNFTPPGLEDNKKRPTSNIMSSNQQPTAPKGDKQPQRGTQRTFHGSSLTFPSVSEDHPITPTGVTPDIQQRRSQYPSFSVPLTFRSTPENHTDVAPERYQQPSSGVQQTTYQPSNYQHASYSNLLTYLPDRGPNTFMGYRAQAPASMHQTPSRPEGQAGGYMDYHGFRRSFLTPPISGNANMLLNSSTKRRGSSPCPLANKRQNTAQIGQTHADDDYKAYGASSDTLEFGNSFNILFDLPNPSPSSGQQLEVQDLQGRMTVTQNTSSHSAAFHPQPQQLNSQPAVTGGKHGFGPPIRCPYILCAKTGKEGNHIAAFQCERTFHPKHAGQTHCYNHQSSQAQPSTIQNKNQSSQPKPPLHSGFVLEAAVQCAHMFAAKKGRKGNLIPAAGCQRTFIPSRMGQRYCYQHEKYHNGEQSEDEVAQHRPQRNRSKDTLVQCAHVFPPKGGYHGAQCQKRFDPKYPGDTYCYAHCYEHRSEEPQLLPASQSFPEAAPFQTPQQLLRLPQAIVNTDQPSPVQMGRVAGHDYFGPGIRCAFTWAGHWYQPEHQCKVMFHPTEEGQMMCPLHILCQRADPFRL
jgi:hypothetical protein